MGTMKIIAIALLIGGALAIAYGGFTFTKETHTTDIGDLSLSFDEKETVSIPMWAGIGAMVLGGLMLIAPIKS